MALGVGKDGPKDLFGSMKPLSSFSAKIRMGFALKLYGERTFHDLELLRKLETFLLTAGLPLISTHRKSSGR